MATERVIISVESNVGEDGPLTVGDTLDQLRDAFDLLVASVSQEEDGGEVKWRLERLTKNSPATMTAVAFSDNPDVVVGPIALRGKQRLSHDMNALRNGEVADWLITKAPSAKPLLKRNLNGIGKTVFSFDDDAPMVVLAERSARAGLQAIERREAEDAPTDRSREEYGTIDAHVVRTDTYRGKPAIYIKDRISGKVVPCVLTNALAEAAGPTHSWSDAWSGKRVRVKGRVYFDKDGEINRVSAIALSDVKSNAVDLANIRAIDLLSGKSPTQHIDAHWEYSDE